MASLIFYRVSGVVFIALLGYHAMWMTATRYGRAKLAALLPGHGDLKDALAVIKYNLGMSVSKPIFKRYNYVEKAEYWALIWGSFVMIITGLVLMFRDISLHFFPKWLIDVMLVVHFFEAVLATLAIIVWHLYWVMFDPDIYPMNWTWITGKETEHWLEDREPGVGGQGEKKPR